MKSYIIGICLFLLFSHTILSQSITLSVVQPKCNNNGILKATITGVIPPYDVVWYEYQVNPNTIVATQSNVTTFTTQISNQSKYVYVAEVLQGGLVAATSSTVFLSSVVNVAQPWGTTMSYSCPAAAASVSLGISGGTLPYNIVWQQWNGTGTINTGEPCNLPAGSYNYFITDAAGCQNNAIGSPAALMPLYVTYNSGITYSVNTTVANCTNGTASVTSIVGGTAPYTYLWDNGLTSSSVNNLTKGWKNVTVTDANGCYENKYFVIAQTPTLNVGTTDVDASCLLSNGSATVFASGGTAPYSYQWANGQNTQVISNLTSGYYPVNIIDANGCLGNSYADIQQTTPIVATVSTSVSQCTAATGSASLTLSGGQAPYSITWNTYPVQTGMILSNVSSGQYFFTVTDANGCANSGNVSIMNVSNLNGSILTSPETCNQNNGSAQVYLSSPGASPYTYLWSNGATTPIASNLPNGAYSCTLTDAANCKLVKLGNVYSTSPIKIGFNTTPTSCLFSSDGAISTIVSNGTAPYAYYWSTNATSPNISGIPSGNYYLSVTDAAGCVAHDYTFLGYNTANTNCYCIISGTVYNDANLNCIQDIGELGIPHVRIDCSGIGYAYSDANGVYSFTVPAGTYTLTEHLNANYQISGCQNNTAVVITNPSSGCIIYTNFANTVIPVHDLHIITTSVNQPVPGNNYTQKIIVVNEGTYNENNIQVSYAHDGQLDFTNSTIPFIQANSGVFPNWYSVNNGFATLTPLASSSDIINYYVPTNISAGTNVTFNDTTSSMAPVSSNWTSDYTPWNNINNYNTTVVSSYDPNFKEVTPKGIGPYGIISYNDTILEYVIHFQNTGTYYAQNIYILDTLDSDLDWESFIPGYADHNYTASMSLNGIVKFSFNNIYLPYYGDASNGMVSYRIKTKKNLLPGTEFRNNAAIFFDYNAPIITNTTINSLQILSGINENQSIKSTLNLYPNPSHEKIKISLTDKNGELLVYDLLGKVVFSQKTISDIIELNVSSFPEGLYIIKFIDTNGLSNKIKFIKN